MEQNEVRGKVAWTSEEDYKLTYFVNTDGPHHWDSIARKLGIGRSGNSCRLRWLNYLSPDVRREEFSDEEMLLILNLHHQLGNRWSKIAMELPGRTDNAIKNLWNTRVVKEAKQLNCDVESEEFRQIMTARLTARTSMEGGGGTAATVVTSFPAGSTHSDQDFDEFLCDLSPICELHDDDDFPWDG